ncbi:sigma-54 dependent transcriptional regulator [Deferribacterales bacterium Es71-Z0220]|jgi:two-component system response regulator HydG|uniref:sigma-54-dependent transcriptional regulator n=1 Tax=Deferrivibrio essentukiensis TaxID=2880922 RepID=UPI001F618E16|nr:sigma-54 dependent transcriptional regulator [Deferrivibrio essentukiensis]MBZ4671842.1 two component, sigma54 specific, transcriptional regulator, Fis family [Deferribacteraceae bacterium]MCB4204747.1 sigma-54 dependent transcriptional regulator [Deferrivibrio essentukiensis]
MGKKILIVDDEQNHRLMLKIHLEDAGYEILEAENGLDGLYLAEENELYAILLDIKMSVMDGLTVLTKLKEKGLNTPVIMITAFNNVRTAVETMKLGAVDFITKPVDIDMLLKSLDNLEKVVTEEIKVNNIPDDFIFEGVYSKEGLGKIVDLLKMVAPTDASVMIYGESGTGKELVAKAIHNNSPRKNSQFLAVNCAALNENLIESELFGHEKGAFTGATSLKKGKFELADGGTIFLDEIGEMPLSTQAKLLRVLQEREFERVGGVKTIKTDTRVIAATNRDLEAMVKSGDFREDLYFRLNVFPVKLPPLRERKTEIPLLVNYFLEKYASRFSKVIKGYTKEFIEKLSSYNFPGNIRELENIIERSIILCTSDKLSADVLPELKIEDNEDIDTLDVKENEKQLIIKALKETNNNKSNAAKILGISRKTLHNKIKEYEIEV